jgi:hypothetical protein
LPGRTDTHAARLTSADSRCTFVDVPSELIRSPCPASAGPEQVSADVCFPAGDLRLTQQRFAAAASATRAGARDDVAP